MSSLLGLALLASPAIFGSNDDDFEVRKLWVATKAHLSNFISLKWDYTISKPSS